MQELQQLLSGYRHFQENQWSDERQRWQELSEGQSPEVMIIACSDSRVDPTQIFHCRPGEIFVVRNVAALYHLMKQRPAIMVFRRRWNLPSPS